MSPEFKALFSTHVAQAFAKQLAFSDLLGDRGWDLDLSTGQVTFGDDLFYKIQLLGTESDGDDSWLWAWANKASNFSSEVLKSSFELQEIGKNKSIFELSERSFKTEVASGHMLALLATGINSEYCYYRGPYDGGAVYFLITNPPEQVLQPVDTQRAITVIMQCISQFEVDHNEMAKSFLTMQNFNYKRTQDKTVATREDGAIEIEFNAKGLIENINATLAPSKSAQKKRKWNFW